MNVLAIETSGPIGSAAACRDEEVVAEDCIERGMEHGRMLVPLIDRVVARAGWDKRRDIEMIAISLGPGSYTGLRVGIACAKTLAALLDKPLIGACSLDAMAENAPVEYTSVLTALDAKRGEVYAAAYERRNGVLVRTAGPAVMTPAQARELLAWPVYVMGDALSKYAGEFLPPGFVSAPEERWRIRAAAIARLGLAAFRRGKREEPVSLQPIYLRLPEAEEKRRAREQGLS